MPLRAFFDSDRFLRDNLPDDYQVLMPLRAFFDSDLMEGKFLLMQEVSLNALTGIF